MSLTITDLPTAWYDGGRYRPRIRRDDGARWFVLDERFEPVTQVPTEAPSEPSAGREALAGAFDATYRDWGLSTDDAARRSLDELGQPGTAVITTGQQPGFLGGPLYTLFKALTAVAAARAYRRTTGRPCVPVFWVAGDDHDLDEIRTTYLPASGSGLDEDLAFTYPTAADRRPIACFSLDDSSRAVVDSARSHLRQRRFGERAMELVDLYESRSLAGGFAALLCELLSGTGLVVIDPVRLRSLAAPLFERVVNSPDRIIEAIHSGRERVQANGLRPVVGDRFPLFLLVNGKRHHLNPTADGMRIENDAGTTLSRQELVAMLTHDPSTFSTGALLRPLLQQYTLPSVLSIGGAAEVGYHAQLAPLAKALDVDAPRIALRLNATLVDGRTAQTTEAATMIGLSTAESATAALVKGQPSEEQVRIRELSQHVEGELNRALDTLPENLPQGRRLRSGAAKIAKDIRTFSERIDKARTQTQEAQLLRMTKLWNQVFPGGVLQERRWNVLHFVAKHGTDWIGELCDHLMDDPLKLTHRLVAFRGARETQDNPDEDSSLRPTEPEGNRNYGE